ncbi:hypothetical protein LTR37_018008 [Vermiconidia calcicola]|uniref:Uncharacterized protein n=1 Tax=Vermiconidia calcicola TaxID=1690605 RepID=A0ACC3MJD0_9PEZI|nr:hypothetical protein LTR37_018008 [Vermiconidia calcicola]
MASVLLICGTLIAAYFSTFIYCLIRNLFNARKTGLPAIIVPFDQNHILWMMFSVPYQQWFREHLPRVVYDRLVLCMYGWEFHEKLGPFEKFSGPRGNDKTYVLVTCGRFELWSRDAEMGKFGANVITSDGDKWTRHRKVVASVLNERISKAVFNESVRQTQGLLGEVAAKADPSGTTETNKMFDWAKKITIHVLSGAGMGASVQWSDDSSEKPPPGFKQTYIQSIKVVIEGVTGPLLLPRWLCLNYPSFLPGYETAKAMGYALDEFPKHTSNMLDNERRRTQARGSVTKGNIMSQLLQASEQSADPDLKKSTGNSTNALSEKEMISNLFIFTAAGFDTTANTISYALVLLARYPEWQHWLLGEIDEIVPKDPTEELDYVAVFPKATRLLAFMLEVLRHYTPLVHISKQTQTAQTIPTSRGTYLLPAYSTVYINSVALHLDPDVWCNLNLADDETGSDKDEFRFRPTRWINPPGSAQPLFQPPKGAYLPWSGGPRVCPGQKMAQVEFCAVFLTLLRQHEIGAVPLENESREDTEKRLEARIQNSMSILTSQMKDVYDVQEGNPKGLKMRISRR